MSVHCILLYFAVPVVSLFTGMVEVTTQYTLWSSKMDPVHVPVQLQFLDDSQFISQILKQQNQSVQVSNSNSSASDLKSSDLAQSDGDTSIVRDKNVSNSDSLVSGKPSTFTSVSQDTNDTQILAQLLKY